jgi:hypothetical protein
MLPIFINTHVFESIIANCIDDQWSKPAFGLLQFTSKLMEAASEKFIASMKEIKALTRLRTFLTSKSCEVIESLEKETKRKLDDFIQREKVPYTQDHYLFENISKLRSQRLMDEVMDALRATKGTDKEEETIRNVFERNQKRSVDDGRGDGKRLD